MAQSGFQMIYIAIGPPSASSLSRPQALHLPSSYPPSRNLPLRNRIIAHALHASFLARCTGWEMLITAILPQSTSIAGRDVSKGRGRGCRGSRLCSPMISGLPSWRRDVSLAFMGRARRGRGGAHGVEMGGRSTRLSSAMVINRLAKMVKMNRPSPKAFESPLKKKRELFLACSCSKSPMAGCLSFYRSRLIGFSSRKGNQE
jgi:hypothetical protein